MVGVGASVLGVDMAAFVVYAASGWWWLLEEGDCLCLLGFISAAGAPPKFEQTLTQNEQRIAQHVVTVSCDGNASYLIQPTHCQQRRRERRC